MEIRERIFTCEEWRERIYSLLLDVAKNMPEKLEGLVFDIYNIAGGYGENVECKIFRKENGNYVIKEIAQYGDITIPQGLEDIDTERLADYVSRWVEDYSRSSRKMFIDNIQERTGKNLMKEFSDFIHH